jgi:EAL domain-containing protein (putative c-di-GMP-specific phosphodiesterase class I)
VVDDVAAALDESGLPPDALVLEMTESVLLDDSETVLAILRQLKGLGVRLAIDDFGTGYSSLSYLHRFPVDILKIDRSFVERLNAPSTTPSSPGRWSGWARACSQTVAEGVEDSAQYLALRRMGCDVGQGFYFGRPMESDDMDRLVGDELTVARTAITTT